MKPSRARPGREQGTEAALEGQDYSAPAIEWEEQFDVVANLASACAKVALQNLACNVSPSS